jgi:hypothetical protein
MARPDAGAEAAVAAFARDVAAALGEDLVCLALHGSAAGDDWVAGRSDLNAVIVVPQVTLDVLETLAPVVARWSRQGFVPPVVMDHEYLDRARDSFPMELLDLRRQHRLLAGTDVLTGLAVDRRALRAECESEARGKLLRLRARFLEVAGAPAALDELMLESLKTFLIVLRHLLGLRGVETPPGYRAVLAAGERLLGPLPAMGRLLGLREGGGRRASGEGRAEFARYLAEVERIVRAVDALDA